MSLAMAADQQVVEDFPCETCGKTFDTALGLQGHSTAHRPIIVCPECGKKYRFVNALSNHRRKEHGVDDGQGTKKKMGRPAKTDADPSWDVDDIFTAVLKLVFPNGAVPLHAVPILVRWRDGTKEMLEEIGGLF